MRTFILALLLPQLVGAAPFENLGFEDARINDFSGPPPLTSSAATLVPSWKLSQGGVGWNVAMPFQNVASLLDSDFRDTHFGKNSQAPVVGKFSLGIWAANTPGSSPFSVSQTGDIPGNAQSLRFLYHGSDLKVYAGGSLAPILFLEDRPSSNPDAPLFHYYAVDVSGLAGQTAELRFEFRSHGYDDFGFPPRLPGQPDAMSHVLDDLSFSPLPAVPEPGTWALLGVGGLGALLAPAAIMFGRGLGLQCLWVAADELDSEERLN